VGDIRIKRIYDPPQAEDGFRVLVDRLWPRGVTRERADIDLWLKGVAPSADLRTWWNHDPARMAEFARRYREELDANRALGELREVVEANATTTLLYAAHDPEVNHARVLQSYLRSPS
jgi:uncharacterized protein YeaO (DUF488 family)